MTANLKAFFPIPMDDLPRKIPEKYWNTRLPLCKEFSEGVFIDIFGLPVIKEKLPTQTKVDMVEITPPQPQHTHRYSTRQEVKNSSEVICELPEDFSDGDDDDDYDDEGDEGDVTDEDDEEEEEEDEYKVAKDRAEANTEFSQDDNEGDDHEYDANDDKTTTEEDEEEPIDLNEELPSDDEDTLTGI
jgi:hypothetical protein